MATLGIDYSWARPGGAAIRRAGYSFVCRYLSNDTTGKTINAGEAKDLLGNGLGVVLVWEQKAKAALNGRSQGISDAQTALAQANGLGFPGDRPIYFAVDFDEADTAAQNDALQAYFDGVASVIGLKRTGIYSGFYPMERLHAAGKVTWMWQTLAWSGGQVFSGAHIYQNGKSAFGSGADVDEALLADIGAWASGSSVTTDNAPTHTSSSSTPTNSSGPGGTYTVGKGDTLSGIGSKKGVDWRAVAQLNDISSPYTIYPGEILKLPGSSPSAPTASVTSRYTVVSGDTLSGIASKYGVQWSAIASANGIKSPYTIYPGQVLVLPGAGSPAPSPSSRTYTVVSGDTLSGIGSKLGVDWHSIASKNRLNAPYTIFPGQVLQIP